jgi:hypothetical protein
METNEIIQPEENTKVYPLQPDAEGFYFEDAGDEELDITTKLYDNGAKVKKILLPSCGKLAIVRSLKAKDSKLIARFTAGDQEKYLMASVTVATTLDGAALPFEKFEDLSLKDYTRLCSMNNDLNF